MDISDKITLGFFGLFAAVGTVCAIIAFVSYRSTYRIVHGGLEAEGIVVENYAAPRAVGKLQGTAMAPVVQFRATNGEVLKYTSTTFTTPVSHPVGAAVRIWYLPENPQVATLEGVDSWLIPVVLGGFGLVFCLIGWPTVLRTLWQA